MLLISDIDYNNRFPKLSFVDYTSKLEMQLKTAYPDLDVRKLVFADATLSNVTRELLQAPDIFYFCGHLHFQPYSIHKLNPAIAMQSMQIPNVFFPLSSSFPHLPKDDFQLYQSYDLPAPLLSVFLCCGGTQGSLLSGESVLGFPRTILMNGGHTVVTTMWDIKPEHVNQFFPKVSADIFNNGISVEEALGNAQRDLISQNNYLSHPRYWAGKIAIGHGGIIVKPQQSTQPPIQLETGSDSYQQASNYWFYVCGAIGILAFLVIVMLFRLKVLPWQRR